MRSSLALGLLLLLGFGSVQLARPLVSVAARAQTTGVCGVNPGPPDPTSPAIIISAPHAGDVVHSPLAVQGQARVFEAVVSLALKDANGATIVAATTQSAAGAPALEPFATTLSFNVTQPTPACLWVFEASARDGSTINVVQTPLTLEPAASPGSGTASYAAGWNLVAGPAGTIFTGAVGPLYTYQAGDTAYEAVPGTTASVGGRGYWAYFTQPATVVLAGPSAPSASVPAPAGQWVMVGNPSATMPAHVSGADLLFGYDPASGGYAAITTLAPGHGAWAISFSGGTIGIAP
jgi:hypothetical protein